jgi:hypothetical protein
LVSRDEQPSFNLEINFGSLNRKNQQLLSHFQSLLLILFSFYFKNLKRNNQNIDPSPMVSTSFPSLRFLLLLQMSALWMIGFLNETKPIVSSSVVQRKKHHE